jgi:hypothetical protein
MSVPILGFATSDVVEVERAVVNPMREMRDRVFSSEETIRVFAIINSPADAVDATLEIRRASTGRLIGSLPATVREGVPLLTARQQYQRDSDDDPLTPVPVRASELDVVVSLAGLANGPYVLRLVAADPNGASYQRVEIEIVPPGDLK